MGDMDETSPEIAGFQIVEPIGRGGMGEVFRAPGGKCKCDLGSLPG